jgi:hypothetical protein
VTKKAKGEAKGKADTKKRGDPAVSGDGPQVPAYVQDRQSNTAPAA